MPAADVGFRSPPHRACAQRIQSLGRVLRKGESGSKRAEMHVLYVADTVDEFIYAKEDWADLTGQDANVYWRWTTSDVGEPVRESGPPQTPRPTEEQEWERLEGEISERPVWRGSLPERDYSVDTAGNVTTRGGLLIANPQGAGEMVEHVRGRPGGRFWVTPRYRLVLVHRPGENGSIVVAGQLEDGFGIHEPDADGAVAPIAAETLRPGDQYPGRLDKTQGTYSLRQKRGGVIERPGPNRSREFALTEGTGRPDLEANATSVLDAWRQVSERGFDFSVNSDWHAWYVEGGSPRFLAVVSGGFAWPRDEE